MVKFYSASFAVKDTATIELERDGVSLDRNGDGALRESCLQSSDAHWCDVCEVFDACFINEDFRYVKRAVLVFGSVGIVFLAHNTTGHSVVECILAEATSTTEVSKIHGAINQLLLRELIEGSVFLGESGL